MEYILYLMLYVNIGILYNSYHVITTKRSGYSKYFSWFPRRLTTRRYNPWIKHYESCYRCSWTFLGINVRVVNYDSKKSKIFEDMSLLDDHLHDK